MCITEIGSYCIYDQGEETSVNFYDTTGLNIPKYPAVRTDISLAEYDE
jgi:hypothetical protein